MEAFKIDDSEVSWPRRHEYTEGRSSTRSAASRFIRDFVELDAPYEKAKIAFLDGGAAWLEPLASDADAEGERLRIRIGVGDENVLAREIRLSVSEARELQSEVLVSVTWEASQVTRLFPRLDADLGLAPIGRGMCQLWLDGTYKPPLGRTGQLIDQAVMHRVAESTIRGFLVRVARSLEDLTE